MANKYMTPDEAYKILMENRAKAQPSPEQKMSQVVSSGRAPMSPDEAYAAIMKKRNGGTSPDTMSDISTITPKHASAAERTKQPSAPRAFDEISALIKQGGGVNKKRSLEYGNNPSAETQDEATVTPAFDGYLSTLLKLPKQLRVERLKSGNMDQRLEENRRNYDPNLPDWTLGKAFRGGISDTESQAASAVAMNSNEIAAASHKKDLNDVLNNPNLTQVEKAAILRMKSGGNDSMMRGVAGNRDYWQGKLQGWSDYADPGAYNMPTTAAGMMVHDVVRATPYTLASMAYNAPIGLLTGGSPLTLLLSSAMASSIEAQGEGSSVYDELRKQGMGHDEAYAAAQDVIKKNMGLLMASNYLQSRATYGMTKAVQAADAGLPTDTLLGKGVARAYQNPMLAKILRNDAARELASTGLDILSEGGEEVGQGIISNSALGQPNDPKALAYEGVVGGLMGALFGAAGAASDRMVNGRVDVKKSDPKVDAFMDKMVGEAESDGGTAASAAGAPGANSTEPRKFIPDTQIYNEMLKTHDEIGAIPEEQRTQEDMTDLENVRAVMELYTAGQPKEAEALAKENFDFSQMPESLEKPPSAPIIKAAANKAPDGPRYVEVSYPRRSAKAAMDEISKMTAPAIEKKYGPELAAYAKQNGTKAAADVILQAERSAADVHYRLGKKSNLDKGLQKTVRTEPFKKFFGDWENSPDSASKVVDANGEPLVVYHGTGKRFNEFRKDKLGSQENAFFFTSNKESAKEYGGDLIPVFLDAKRFARLDENYRDANGVEHDVNSPEFRKKYDGYSVDEGTDWNEYAVFEPTQIKAIDNKGTFDTKNADIRYSLGKRAQEKLELDSAAFAKQVDQFVQRKVTPHQELTVMQTPLAIQISDARVKPLPIVMSQRTLAKVFSKHKLSPDLVKQLPKAMADPIMVLQSEGKASQLKDGLVVMLEMKDHKGNTINVPLALNTEHNGPNGKYECNDIASVYGRESSVDGLPFDQWFVDQAKKPGNLKYINTEKFSRWVNQTRLVVPEGKSNGRTENNISANNKNVNGEDANIISRWIDETGQALSGRGYNNESLQNTVKTEVDLAKAQNSDPENYKLGKAEEWKGQSGHPRPSTDQHSSLPDARLPMSGANKVSQSVTAGNTETSAKMPALSVEAIKVRVKGADVADLGNGRVKLTFPGGKTILVDTMADEISIDPEVVRRDYGRDVSPEDVVAGRTRIIGGRTFIDLVAGMSDAKTFSHEVFESTWDLLSEEDKKAVLDAHHTREEAAERYAEFLEGRVGKVTGLTRRIFQKIRDFYDGLRASMFGKKSEDVFREIATGKAYGRPGAVGEVSTRSDATLNGLGAKPAAEEHYRTRSKKEAAAAKADENELAAATMTSVNEKTGEVERNIRVPKKRFTGAEQTREVLGNEQWQKDVSGTGLESVVSTRAKKKTWLERLMPHEGWFDEFTNEWRDDLNPLLVNFGKDFHMKATNEMHGAYSRGLYRVLYGAKEKGVKALKEILKMIPDGEHNGFATYAVLKHLRDVARTSEAAQARMNEIEARLQEKGLPKSEKLVLEHEAATLDKQVKKTKGKFAGYDAAVKKIEAHYPKWAAAQQELTKYNQALIELMADEGIISRDLYDELLKRYPNYVPLQRDFGDKDGSALGEFIASRGLVNVSAPIKKLHGSVRDVIDPFEQILRNSFQFEAVAARQRVARDLVKGYDEGSYRDLFEEIMSPQDMKKKAKELFAKAGSAKTAAEKEALQKEARGLMARSETANPYSAHSPTQSTFYIYEDGKKRHFLADNDIYQALMLSGARSAENNIVHKIMTLPAKTLRGGTTHGLTFAVRNMIRDTVSYAILGKEFRPFVDTAIGMAEAITNNQKLYEDFMKNGGLQGMTNVSADRMSDMINELKRNKKNLFLDAFKLNGDNAVWKFLGDISELSETASRLGQYKRLIEAKNADGTSKYTKEEAIYLTRDNMNFMRAGRVARNINQYVAFFNAGIQGVDKMCRAFYHDGHVDKKTLLRAGLYLTLPSMLQLAWNYSDDDRKKKYQNLPAWRKNLFWNIVVGDTTITIPKPFEMGLIFGSLPERMVDTWVGNDENAFEGFTGSLFSAMTPEMAPNIMLLAFELGSGYSKFYDRQIVPQRERGLEPEMQYGPYTSEVAKGMAKGTKYLPDFEGVPLLEQTSKVLKSPRMLEYAYSQLTGGFGKEASNLADLSIRTINGESRPSKPWWQTMPGFRGLFADASVGGRDQELFQKEVERLMTKVRTAYERLETKGPASLSETDVRTLDAEEAIKYTAKLNTSKNGIYDAYKNIRAINMDKTMTAKEKAAAIREEEMYIRDASHQGLSEIRDIYAFLRGDL